MCGIVGYLGKKSVIPVILDSLQSLEYRGYDSAGVAFLAQDQLNVYKSSGKLRNLRSQLPEELFEANGHERHLGIGHTRWATHGAPNDQNAHPHVSCDGNIALIHNGIVENYGELREELKQKGHRFHSKTDTECVVHLIEEYAKTESDMMTVLQRVTQRLVGAYALVIIDKRNPDKLYGVRNHAPLVIGIGENELLLGSDIVALVEHTSQVSYLRDGEIVELSPDGFRVVTFQGEVVEALVETISGGQLVIDKKGYKHFMLKEIYEQPDVIRNSLSGRLISPDEPIALLSEEQMAKLQKVERISIVACGTSFHAGLVGKYFIEEMVRIPVDVEAAGEFRYRNPLVDEKTLVIAISQSGETADTISALRQCRDKGANVVAITNREDSTIARESDIVLPVRAGIEVSVCATKSFTAQVIVLYLLGLYLAEIRKTAPPDLLKTLKAGLQRLPVMVESVLHSPEEIQAMARKYGHSRDMIFIARGINFPVALEGALKLKEISYIHAEGYSASELKHGPIAILEESIPVVAILTNGIVYDKMISNCQEAKARDAKVIAVNSGTMPADVKDTFEDVFFIPQLEELLSPILTAVPLQLLAYYIAEYLGKDVDQPRNLAKSVTVE
jgi:glutamine---fructose-6-phosphate transaminase (isomerizing)